MWRRPICSSGASRCGFHGPDRAVVVVEHAHQFDGQVADVAHARVDVGPRDGAGRRGLEVAEIGLFAGAGVGVRDVQA